MHLKNIFFLLTYEICICRWARPRREGSEAEDNMKADVTVETVCVVDVRDNTAQAASIFDPEVPQEAGAASGLTQTSAGAMTFNPTQLIHPTGTPRNRPQLTRTLPRN